MVRSGARQSRVEGVFLLNGDIAQKINVALDEYEIDGGEEEMILAREVNLDGRNTCRVNGRIVPLRLLSTLAERLVDIHGQSQHLSLFRVREHMDVLDQYGGLWQLRTQVAERVRQLMEVRRELDRLRTDEQELAQRVDVLRYQVGRSALPIFARLKMKTWPLSGTGSPTRSELSRCPTTPIERYTIASTGKNQSWTL